MSHIGGSWYWRMLSEQVELEEKKHAHVSEHKEEKVVVSPEDEDRYLDSEQGVVVNMSIVSEAASQIQDQQQEVAHTEAVEQKEPQVEVANVEHDDDVDADIDPDVSIEVKTEPVRRVKVRRKSREQE
ncbi:MAG: hypothetical protein ABIK73_07190 [candidate division WOR-3 bacterium]